MVNKKVSGNIISGRIVIQEAETIKREDRNKAQRQVKEKDKESEPPLMPA